MFSPPKKKKLDHKLKIKLNSEKLSIHLDKNFTWKHQKNNIAVKLNEANAGYPK